jgi:hypothetical protein
MNPALIGGIAAASQSSRSRSSRSRIVAGSITKYIWTARGTRITATS